ncbi:DNA-directed RNA polymerase 2 subunit [Cryptosporidium ryanae]|uniref:DNA-directed RNA polymerase 2 subunit n=1 Tax=Cryptosporidium ryanae TaxID=515981 RepID=UPI00351A8953|nr:DNA-directed RNA polymerase 2 subunit [Cryptosporidium ryanae]
MEKDLRFCPECNNILCPREDVERKRLLFACRNCDYYSYSNPNIPEENVVNSIAFNYVGKEDVLVNKDMHQDPALGRTHDWVCRGCGHNVAVFFQLPERVCSDAMTLVFVCVSCGEWVKEDKNDAKDEDDEYYDDQTSIANPYFIFDEDSFQPKREIYNDGTFKKEDDTMKDF